MADAGAGAGGGGGAAWWEVQMDVLQGGRRERGEGDAVGESYDHWSRALVVMLGRLGSLYRDGASARGFVSVAVPAVFAEALAARVAHGGLYVTRLSACVGEHGLALEAVERAGGSRMLTCWRLPPADPTPVAVEADPEEAEAVIEAEAVVEGEAA